MNPPPFAALAFAVFAVAATHSPAAEFHLNGHRFTIEPGFSIDLAAPADLIPRPISGSFDPQGRLYVTDSSGLNLPPSEQLKDPRNRILRLDDQDGDGRFDRATVFADRVMFPQGCLWHEGSVYVAGPPSIWKFTDTDGDGVADKREEWYQGKVLTGCANDVHGPYLGPEGMLYWTKGAFARLDLKDHKGRPIQDRCAHLFRARPDGSGFETVMSGGMDNPVEVAFTPDGEPILISTFIDLSQPGRRDGLAHAVYGGVFGKVHDVVEEAIVKRTGDLLPAMTHFGPAAACALMRYEGDAFGQAYQDNLFATLFNLRKVTRHVLQPRGASYATDDSDFLVSDHMDFRPTDVLQDADGSLLVIDTGGWYKLCCPSSQLAKADVLGGIYRIRRAADPAAGAARNPAAYQRLTEPPRLHEISAETQLKRLALAADAAQAVRLRDALHHHTATASSSPRSARLVRIAAEGLGRMGDRQAVPFLIQAIATTGNGDRFLEHSLLYALIEIGDADGVRTHLRSANVHVQRAALLALEQIDGNHLQPADVAPWLASPSAPLRHTAHWIARRHPEWSDALVGEVRRQIAASTPSASPEDWDDLLRLLAASASGRALIAQTAAQPGGHPHLQAAALRAMAQSGLKETPPDWIDALRTVLSHGADRGQPGSSSTDPALHQAALRAVRGLPLPRQGDPGITRALHALARRSTLPVALRVDALAALPAASPLEDPEFQLLLDSIVPSQSPEVRLAAATAIGRLHASPSQLRQLAAAATKAGPLELPRVLPAFAACSDDATGQALLESLRQSTALRSLRPEDLKPHLGRFPEPIRQAADDLLVPLRQDAAADRERLDVILEDLKRFEGGIREGQALFNSDKLACASCHRLGYLGGNVGPDLTSIGTVRSERDLLEALLYPSASFVRSYEPWVAVAKDGEEYTGVLRRETDEEVILATGPGAEVRVARGDLAELRPGTLSTMPAGLDEQLTRKELADLLAFLKNTKWGAN